ncbi:MFS transporter [Myceligenerans halotolerans]
MTLPATPASLRQNRAAVLAAFFAQGFVFVSATLSIPKIVREFDLDPGVFSMFLLGMVLAAAVGSAIAEVAARRAGSAAALRAGLATMVPALALMYVTGHLAGLAAGMVLYGITLGMVDAGSNMQAVTLERRYGRPILPSSQGAWTLGGLVATGVSLAGVATLPLATGAAFSVVALLAAFAPFQGRAVLAPDDAAASTPTLRYAPETTSGTVPGMLPDSALGPIVTSGTVAAPPPVPTMSDVDPSAPSAAGTSTPPDPTAPGLTHPVAWAAIAPAGIAFLIFYLVDSATQAWGPLYLDLVLNSPEQLVALATLPYLAANLLVRLAGDHLTARFGAPALVRTGAMVAFAGLAAVVLAPVWPVAAAGFFLTGLGLGAVAPLSFSAAGRIAGGDRARADVVVARFNQLNYVGALVGSVVTGLISTGSSLRIGFTLPLLLVLTLIPLARGFGTTPRAEGGERREPR